MEDKELKNSTISYKWKNTKLIHVDDVIKSGIPINGITELDLMGGKKSIMEGLVNVDVLAEEGIKARVEDLNKIIKKNSCRKIIVNNPYGVNGMTLLKIAKDLLEPGAEIMISGTLSNKHFNVLIKKNRTEEIQNLGFSFHFEKGQLDETLKDKEFHQSSGEKISKSKMMTFYATKKAEIPKTIEANFSAKLEVNNGKIS